MDIGFFVKRTYEGKRLVLHHLREPCTEARIAEALIERWGIVAARSDGEDSAGRQKLALLTPQELVERACETAALACAEFDRRGWFLHVPQAVVEDTELDKDNRS